MEVEIHKHVNITVTEYGIQSKQQQKSQYCEETVSAYGLNL